MAKPEPVDGDPKTTIPNSVDASKAESEIREAAASDIEGSDRKPAAAELSADTANFFTDLEAIRLSTEDAGEIGTREILTRVPVRKPRRGEFFRCHPEPKMSLSVTVYVDQEEQDEVYFVAPAMRGELAEDLRAVLLQLAISRKRVVFIWPLTISSDKSPLGRSWHETARKAAEIAKEFWIRITADKSLGGYRVRKAEGENLSEPEWPDKSFNELLTIAFADRIIMSEDHPVVRRLRGLV
jgi:hypothetical protein